LLCSTKDIIDNCTFASMGHVGWWNAKGDCMNHMAIWSYFLGSRYLAFSDKMGM
jgi:hypothetical protein